MGVDDRAADRQPHAHAAGFRREEGFEQAVHGFRREARTGVLDRDQHGAGFAALRSHAQHTRLACVRAHRIDRIQDQIQNDLLQLHPVTHDGFEPVGQVGLERNIVLAEFAVHQAENFADCGIDVEFRPDRRRCSGQGADTFDNFAQREGHP